MSFALPPLSYALNGLLPAIDARTVVLHYSKHHQTYCDKLNAWLTGTEYETWSLENLLSGINELPDNLKPIVKNHGGGLHNHNIYRATMTPGWSTPSDYLKSTISKSFGSWEAFETEFKNKATTLFGSGRTWLEIIPPSPLWQEGGELVLQITNYPNQENPLMYWKKPILGCDIREHAYYLSHQNRRAEYVDGWWSLINWDEVEKNLG